MTHLAAGQAKFAGVVTDASLMFNKNLKLCQGELNH